jgi:hypothetical protein
MFQTKFVEKSKQTFYVQQHFFRKLCCLGDNVEKYGRARVATDDNVTWGRKDAICIQDN